MYTKFKIIYFKLRVWSST